MSYLCDTAYVRIFFFRKMKLSEKNYHQNIHIFYILDFYASRSSGFWGLENDHLESDQVDLPHYELSLYGRNTEMDHLAT